MMRMRKPKSFLRVFTETGPLIVLGVAVALMVGVVGPAAGQGFFNNFGNFGGPPRPAPRSGGGWFGGDLFAPFQQQQQPRRIQQDFSKAPPPEKRDNASVPERNVLVLGDGMADWLAYGLEDAYIEQPDMGVIRKAKNTSGLIKYQPKGEPADWAAAAKGILATEKPDAIVVMLGLERPRRVARAGFREVGQILRQEERQEGRARQEGRKTRSKPDGAAEPAAKPDDKAADAELQDDADNADAPPVLAPEKSTRTPNGLYEFREDRWVELYGKKIEEMIAVVKSRGVPVVWVGLPAIRGPRGTADMLFLDSLYRDAAGKAGITYVDVWDGFVDEAGRFLQKGPDFEGQIRQLRSYDGVYFTKPGARKLAHYVEREITRLLAARSAPIALPTEPATPDANAVPGEPAPRPLAGPILPLVASSVGTDQLLGGPGSRPAAVDALAARTLVKGEALTPPAGRADDFDLAAARGRTRTGQGRNAGRLDLARRRSCRCCRGAQCAAKATGHKKLRPAGPSLPNFFGFGNGPRQPAAPRPPGGVPRPPGSVGRSAEAPGFFAR